MGRNIFQSEHPTRMARAVRKIAHEKFTGKKASGFRTDSVNSRAI